MKLIFLSILTFIISAQGFSQTNTNNVVVDTIYKYKNYQIKLIQLGNSAEVNYNYIFTVSKNSNGKQTGFYRDTIESTTQEIQFTDYNNDGIKDILIQNSSDARSNWTYNLYLVSPLTDALKKIKGFNEIKNPQYMPKHNLISNMVMSGRDWTSFYKIQGDSIKDFGIIIYDDHNVDNNTYSKDYNKAIQTILKQEKNKQ